MPLDMSRPEGTSYCAWDNPRAANTFRMPFHDPWAIANACDALPTHQAEDRLT